MTFAYLTTPLLGIVDTAVVGRLGDAALLGGLASGAIAFDVVFTTFNFLRSGTTGLVAQANGRSDGTEERAVLLRSMVIAFVSGLMIVACLPLLVGFGKWFMAAERNVLDALALYLGIRGLSAPFALGNYAILGYVLGRGEGATGLGLQILLNGANIVLSIMFGLHLGYGLEGVAWATVCAEVLAFACGAALLAFRSGDWPSWREVFVRSRFARLASLNFDIMVRSFVLLGAFALFTRQGAQIGTVTLAANALLMNFFMIGGFLLDGFATAVEQLAGKAVGAANRQNFQRSVRLTLYWGLAIAVVLSVGFLVVGEQLIALLTTEPSTISEARRFLPMAAFTALTGVVAFQMDGVYIGATWSRDMRNMMLLSFALYLVLLALLVPQYGNYGLWLALHLFLLARGITLFARMPANMRETFG